MTRFCAAVLVLVLSMMSVTTAQAQEWTLALGTTDFGDGGDDSATVEAEYRFKPFNERRVVSFAFGLNGSVTGEGDVFIGGGLWTRWEWPNGWFIDNSIMPGLYEEGTDGNDLGSSFEFRSLIGFGYRFDNGSAISAAFTHKSNASLADDNPGMNAYLLRYHFTF